MADERVCAPSESDAVYPDIVYKYRRWEDEEEEHDWGRRTLTHREVYFTSCADFNDPFDGSIDPVFKKGDQLEMFDRCLAVVRREHPEWTDQRQRQKAYQLRRKKRTPNQKEVREFVRNFRQDRAKRYGLLSLSTICENSLMWGHYADSNRGFCIGYGFERLFDTVNQTLNDGRSIFPSAVEYVDEYPEWNYLALGMEHVEFLEKSIITKHSKWAYENEWRFVLAKSGANVTLTEDDRRVVLDSSVVREVRLGCEIPELKEGEIMACLRQFPSPVKVYKAMTKRGSYDLQFREVVL